MDVLQIVVDTREKRPLPIPSSIAVARTPHRWGHRADARTVLLSTARRALPTGDYSLAGPWPQPVVERKGSLQEVAQNCLDEKDRVRFLDCCRRLRDEVPASVLLFEGAIGDLSPRSGQPHPGVAVDALLDIIGEHRIPAMVLPATTAGQRRAAGEWAVRWLLSAARVLKAGGSDAARGVPANQDHAVQGHGILGERDVGGPGPVPGQD